MKYRIIFSFIGLIIPTLLLADTTTLPDDIPPTSSIALSIGTDSLQNKSRQLQMNIELKKYQQISLGYGDLTSNSTPDYPSLDTRQYYFGIATNPYESWSAGAEYSNWGKKNKLEIESLQSDLYANLNNWSFSLSPQMNIVWLYASNGQTYDIKSRGASVSATYYGLEQYFFGINLLKNKITNNLRFLENPALREIALRRISVSAQLLISGLEKDHQGLSAGRYFDWGSIEIDWTKSNAALVDYQASTLTLVIDYQLSKQFGLSLIASQQTINGSNEPLQAVDLGITAFW